MKKIILGTLLLTVSLFGDIITILPYGGIIDYDKNSAKSAKDRAELLGFYTSVGNLGYLVEFSYSHIDTTYKDATIEDLNQDDITLTYAKYYKNFMLKIGGHFVSTNDEQLGDGNIIMISIGGYNWVGYDKYSYGLEGYYSIYKDGHDEDYIAKSIDIVQFTPYFSFYKAFTIDVKNSLSLKLNYQMVEDYITKDYLSYEISDTIYYKNLFTTLKVYGGEMRTGVKDSGMTVYNTLDLLKNGYSIKLGYYINKDFIISASYSLNSYEEYGKVVDGTASVAVATLSYSF